MHGSTTDLDNPPPLPEIPGLLWHPIERNDNSSLYHAVAACLHNQMVIDGTANTFIQEVERGNYDRSDLDITALSGLLNRQIVVIDSGGRISKSQQPTADDHFENSPIFIHHNGHNRYNAYLLDGCRSSQAILDYLQPKPTAQASTDAAPTLTEHYRGPIALAPRALSLNSSAVSAASAAPAPALTVHCSVFPLTQRPHRIRPAIVLTVGAPLNPRQLSSQYHRRVIYRNPLSSPPNRMTATGASMSFQHPTPPPASAAASATPQSGPEAGREAGRGRLLLTRQAFQRFNISTQPPVSGLSPPGAVRRPAYSAPVIRAALPESAATPLQSQANPPPAPDAAEGSFTQLNQAYGSGSLRKPRGLPRASANPIPAGAIHSRLGDGHRPRSVGMIRRDSVVLSAGNALGASAAPLPISPGLVSARVASISAAQKALSTAAPTSLPLARGETSPRRPLSTRVTPPAPAPTLLGRALAFVGLGASNNNEVPADTNNAPTPNAVATNPMFTAPTDARRRISASAPPHIRGQVRAAPYTRPDWVSLTRSIKNRLKRSFEQEDCWPCTSWWSKTYQYPCGCLSSGSTRINLPKLITINDHGRPALTPYLGIYSSRNENSYFACSPLESPCCWCRGYRA